jgi:hypothetical protein
MSQMKTTAVARTWIVCTQLSLALFGLASAKAEEPAATVQAPWAAEKILPPEPGRKACFQKVFDATHLQAHPEQKVTELLFFLRVSGYDAGGNYVFDKPDHIFYNFAISIRRRNDKHSLRTSGDCLGSDVPQCVVDCDSGGVTIEKLPSGDGLSLRLNEGGIAFGGDCDTKTGVWVKPGADDKVFHLEAVPLEVCRSLEKEQIDPRP